MLWDEPSMTGIELELSIQKNWAHWAQPPQHASLTIALTAFWGVSLASKLRYGWHRFSQRGEIKITPLFSFFPTNWRISVVRRWKFGPLPSSNPNVEATFGASGWGLLPPASCRLPPRSAYKLKVGEMETRHARRTTHTFPKNWYYTDPLSIQIPSYVFFCAIMELHWWRKQNAIRVMHRTFSLFRCGTQERAFSLLTNVLPRFEWVKEKKVL